MFALRVALVPGLWRERVRFGFSAALVLGLAKQEHEQCGPVIVKCRGEFLGEG